MSYYKRSFNKDGQSAESKALDKFADLMIKKIKDIQTDWEKPWFTEGSMRWPRNLNGREYNGSNALGLMLHCENNGYKLPIFCTFNRVIGLNYDKNNKPLTDANGEKLPTVSVNKGEKAFPVFINTYTVVDKETKEKIPFEDYKQLPDEEKSKYIVYPKTQVFQVFNVQQTNMKEARPEMYAKLEAENEISRPATLDGEKFSFPAMDQMIKNNLWHCPIKLEHQDQAYYSPSRDEIVLPEKSQFVDGQSFYGTAWHEMAHSTGAESRLNRLKPSTFGSADYAREELVAELSAALVGSRFGVAKNVKADSASYLKAWLDSLQESPEYIKTTLQDVKKATSMITHRIDLVQDYINDYQKSVGNQEVMPDFLDLDADGDLSEPVFVKQNGDLSLEPVEEVPFKSVGRGR
jgi:antirestriction protein ArdC